VSAARGPFGGRDGKRPARRTDEAPNEPETPDGNGAAGMTDADVARAGSGGPLVEPDGHVTDGHRAPSVRDGESRSREALPSEEPAGEGPGGEREGQGSTAASRARTIAERLAAAALRDELAEVRDRNAAARDHGADARDAHAGLTDSAVEARAKRALRAAELEEVIGAVASLKVSGASNRQQSALERSLAASDREASGDDRQEAAEDRRYSGLDELTGVFRRGTGELALTREIDRSRRSGSTLVLAIIDIDELKAVNDKEGHAAGDALLRDVPTAISSTLRSYDITVRWGGDEFVYALTDVSLEEALSRTTEIQRALEARRPGASISTGLAQLEADDTLESLIARADNALRRAKLQRNG
jgi:diguanylate cyclase (GGDEF)-like protein